jgi:spore coat polysaccharide biosynthesis predicted glycosyltransferase SpsG/molybdopterin-guanine dinucleotide biosynthesis protein A
MCNNLSDKVILSIKIITAVKWSDCMKTWYMIPVRGGSKDVLRKNARNLGGKPLLAYVLETILKVENKKQVVVVTDDAELSEIARGYEVNIVMEEKTTGKATLDNVAYNTLSELYKLGAKGDDYFFTVQATCPFLKTETIIKAKKLIKNNGSILTAVDDRFLSWKMNSKGELIPAYKKRVNRQELPANYIESGAIIGARVKDIQKHKTRIIKPVAVISVDKVEGMDIDDYIDWYAAEYIVKRKRILIKADSSLKIGMGHLYRSSAIAYELSEHETYIVSNIYGNKKLSSSFFKDMPHNFIGVKSDSEFVKLSQRMKPDIIILDQLDTRYDYVKRLKSTGAVVITLEDMGPGAKIADLLISDLYKNPEVEDAKQLTGVQNAFLHPSFTWVNPDKKINKSVDNILLLFGGTDPSNLTIKALNALKAIKYKGFVRAVQGLGRKNRKIDLNEYGLKGEVLTNVKYMPKIMKEADIALSSAGRTITELMTLGTPVLCMCQNKKETTHTHAKKECGVINLGLGADISDKKLSEEINKLIQNYELRKKLHFYAKTTVKGRTNREIVRKISNIIKVEL